MNDIKELLQRFGLEWFNRYYGIYRAQVISNEDPEFCGRLKLKIPQIYGESVYDYWAWSFGIYAGANKGFVMLPSVGDWVWVQFENGESEKPVWSYGWWGKGDMPSEYKSNYSEVTTLQTTGGSRIVLDDRDDSIQIEQKGGMVLDIRDGKINLGTKNGAAEPVLLGDKTVSKLTDLIDELVTICTNTAAITIASFGTPPVNAPIFTTSITQLQALKASLSSIKSTKVKTD